MTALLLSMLPLTAACQGTTGKTVTKKLPPDLSKVKKGHAVALFAGGCFWCMEAPFDALPGVMSTVSGYTDGYVHNPTYRGVSGGVTGHTEAIQITYDPTKITYKELLGVFWRNIDPGAKDRQFCDSGTQYRSGIYTYDAKQAEAARTSLKVLKTSGAYTGPVYTEIKPATRFYRAEEYHQDFYKKKPEHYYRYRKGCGRDARLKALWAQK